MSDQERALDFLVRLQKYGIRVDDLDPDGSDLLMIGRVINEMIRDEVEKAQG